MDQILKVPKQLTSSDALETATFLDLELKGSTKPLIEYDIVEVVNQQQVFEGERNLVRDYRFSGRINLYTANELTPTTKVVDLQAGTTNVITGALNEDYDPLFDGSPALTPNNWLLQLLYPYKSLPEFIIKTFSQFSSYNSLANKGPQILSMVLNQPSGEENKVGVICAQKHNLKAGDFIHICSEHNTIPNPYEGIKKVLSLGIGGENLDTQFILDTEWVGPFSGGISNLRKILKPTREDLGFKNSYDITNVTATDDIGNTSGTFINDGEIHLSIDIDEIVFNNLIMSLGYIPGTGPVPGQPLNEVFTNPSILNYTTFKKISNTLPYIDIRDGGTLNGLFRIVRLIKTNVNQPNKMIIKSLYITNKGQSQTFSLPNNPKFRILDGTPSEYYVREYRVLTTNDYQVYKCGFSSSVYPKTVVNELGIANKTWLYHYNEDIKVGGLVDNLNRPLSYLYLAYIKRAGQNTFPWSNVVAGWDFNSEFINNQNGLEDISRFNTGGVGTIEKPNNNSTYLGDYVEYNSLELKEYVLSKIVHRFGKQQEPNAEGYFLNPFKKMKIMDFSSVIETSSLLEETENIPDYAEVYPNGDISWRDLLPIGFVDADNDSGVDYPFVNGKHYFYGNYNFFLRRQIPQNNKILDMSNIKIAKIDECDCE